MHAVPNNLTRDEALHRTALISNLRYRISLDLTAGAERFGSDTTIEFDCARPGAETFLDFLCDRVARIEINGAGADARAADGTRIAIAGLAGSNVVRIAGEPLYEHSGVGLHRFTDPVDGKVYLHSQFEAFDAHRVFPCFDQPDLKATFEFEIRARGDWEISSNMAPSAVRVDGDARVWSFPATPVMSTYITAIVAGPFYIVKDHHGTIDLGLWCRQSLVQYLEPDEMFEITKQGFDFYEELFDYPYPFGKYDQLFVPEFNAGAMENAGCVTFSEAYIFRSKVTQARRERRAATVLHEMAHMWFGDLVTMKWWDDLWLNESFAEYMALVAQVAATRFTNGFVTFSDTEKTWAYRQDQLPTTHPIAADCPDIESVAVNFDGISYAKGASVLRQLVAWVGEGNFARGLRAYFRRYEFGNADLDGFLGFLEEASGRDLQAWSKEWLETPGVNTLRAQISTDGAAYRSIAIVQEASDEHPVLRSHRIAVGLYDAGDDGVVRRRRVELDVTGARTEIPELAGERVADLLLINDDDLSFAKVRFDEDSLATIRDRLRDVTDPLVRTLGWTMTWDMVRDGEFAARAWARIVYNNIDGETEVGVLRNMLDKVRSAALVYGDPANRAAAMGMLADFALDGLSRAEAGSDRQLVWAQTFASIARSDEHLAILQGFLDGEVPYDGLAIDTDMRWALVGALAAAGKAGEAQIEAELKLDPTDAGNRHAQSARAARPAADAKQRAWALITAEDVSFATMRAAMGAFWRHEQESLLEPYRDRYFEQLVPIYHGRDLQVAMDFAEDMFPAVLISEETAAAAERFLAGSELPIPIRRYVIEGVDGIRRALRARAVDAASGSLLR